MCASIYRSVLCSQKHVAITEDDMFSALEIIMNEKRDQGTSAWNYDEDIVPPLLRRNIAVYEAGKALIGLMSPAYDEVYKVSACPGGIPSGSTFFLPREERLESSVVTRSYMDSKLVVSLAGRCAERLLLGDANISTAGAADLNVANAVAKEMVYRCGFSKHLGPVAFMDSVDDYIAQAYEMNTIPNVSTDIARIAFEECRELLDAAEAKAYYGLATNFPALEALIEELVEREVIGLPILRKVTYENDLQEYKTSRLDGFGWTKEGHLLYPGDGRRDTEADKNGTSGRYSSIRRRRAADWWDPANPYELRTDLAEILREKFTADDV